MLHAAAMLTGLFTLWLVLTQRWSTPVDFAIAAGVAFVCVMFASRFGGLGRSGPFARAPQTLALSMGRAGAVVRGALATVRAAVAADVTLKPALVRLKWRANDEGARVMFADLISSAPGAVVVETETDGALVHVINEDTLDAAAFARLEARVARASGGGGA